MAVQTRQSAACLGRALIWSGWMLFRQYSLIEKWQPRQSTEVRQDKLTLRTRRVGPRTKSALRGVKKVKRSIALFLSPDGFPQKLESSLAWTAATVTDQYDWSYELDESELDDLSSAQTPSSPPVHFRRRAQRPRVQGHSWHPCRAMYQRRKRRRLRRHRLSRGHHSRAARPPAQRPLLYHQPAANNHAERVIIQYARRGFTRYWGLPRSANIPAVTEAQAEALDAVPLAAEKHALALALRPGDIQFVNNLS
ncbi:Taurine catabolism dioxygenase TauD/TfdA [Metarhizium album ARSEF 1941]|uniref:Taurine catabolism dioxygenase TauD/TfdA n=1 Tax=Metarhizium album (strain ARSEF 1941) TaxID=1081103 RepID=A0A0B2X809_METAS|nr:Taurine catabolism dioxygenase TauD/TfdA [Metarhizium album ARSEF 1941]KHO01431.1 Taurine catabolism dioxygenase TauD/TfdA [Metarhizium album ARSEF 1941]